jgi:hypothetical protein
LYTQTSETSHRLVISSWVSALPTELSASSNMLQRVLRVFGVSFALIVSKISQRSSLVKLTLYFLFITKHCVDICNQHLFIMWSKQYYLNRKVRV